MAVDIVLWWECECGELVRPDRREQVRATESAIFRKSPCPTCHRPMALALKAEGGGESPPAHENRRRR